MLENGILGHSRVSCANQVVPQTLIESSRDIRELVILRQVHHAIRIGSDVVEFLAGACAEGEIERLWVLITMQRNPRLGGTGVHVREGGERIFGEGRLIWH